MKLRWAIAIAAAATAASVGCSRCGDEPPQETGAAVYDTIALGGTEATLRAQLAALGGFDPDGAAKFVKCDPLPRIDVLDLDDGALIEKPAGAHTLVRCALMGGRFHRASPISWAQGDLLDGRVVAAKVAFYIGEHDKRRAELEAYLGSGDEVRLEERSALGESQRDAVVWRRGGEAWAILGGRETRILKQDAEALGVLAEPGEPAGRGDKVSLDDIGLGGGLDLEKPLPSDEGLVPKDAGPR
jgi:hypothetical protein